MDQQTYFFLASMIIVLFCLLYTIKKNNELKSALDKINQDKFDLDDHLLEQYSSLKSLFLKSNNEEAGQALSLVKNAKMILEDSRSPFFDLWELLYQDYHQVLTKSAVQNKTKNNELVNQLFVKHYQAMNQSLKKHQDQILRLQQSLDKNMDIISPDDSPSQSHGFDKKHIQPIISEIKTMISFLSDQISHLDWEIVVQKIEAINVELSKNLSGLMKAKAKTGQRQLFEIRIQYLEKILLAARKQKDQLQIELFSSKNPNQKPIQKEDDASSEQKVNYLETQIVKAYQLLDKAHNEWAHTLDVIDDAIFLVDQNNKILHANHAYIKLVKQYHPEITLTALKGKIYWECFPLKKELSAASLEVLHRHRNEYEILNMPNGDSFKIRTIEAYSAEKHFQYSVRILKDVTLQKQLEEKRTVSQARFEILTTLIKDAVIMINNRGRVTFWNKAATELFGFNETEVLGKLIHKLIIPSQYVQAHIRAMAIFQTFGSGSFLNKTTAITAINSHKDEFQIEITLASIKVKDVLHVMSVIRKK